MAKILKNTRNVLVVCQHYWPESFRLNDICDFLIDKNCDIEVLCGIPNYPSGKFTDGYSYFKNRKQIHNGVKIRRAIEIPRGSNTSLRIFVNYISFPIASLFHVPRLLTKKYDRILLYQLSPVMMSFAGIVVGKLRGIETTMYVLDLWPENLFSVLPVHNKFLKSLVTKISHWHYQKVDKLVVLSERMKERLQEIPGLSEKQIIVLPQACEKIYEEDTYDKEIAKRYNNGFNILFTGNISPAQSFDTMLAAASILKKEGIKDINWIIVGDGMSRKAVQEAVKKQGLTDQFHFEGQKPVADMPKYTAIANVLVGCLAKSDLLEATIPAKIMSYIAAGKPMVLAMDGEVRELINDTIRCGFVGPTEASETLAANIRRVYDMPKAEREKMGKKAKAYHFKHFERNIVLNKLHDFMFE